MEEMGQVRLGGASIFAHYIADGATARVWISADDCDRLDLFAGRQVWVGLPDGSPSGALVTGVVPAPPLAWVEMESTAMVSCAG